MPKKRTLKDESVNDPRMDDDDNVDKIREILFGGKMRSYEQRLEALEQRISDQLEQNTANLELQIQQHGQQLLNKFETLSDQIKSEQLARQEDNKEWEKDLHDLKANMDTTLSDLESQLRRESEAAQTALLDQVDGLTAHVNTVQDQWQAEFNHETKKLASDKLGKAELAGLLNQIATGLKSDSQPSS